MKRIKALWTGDFVGRMHIAEVTRQELADEAGVSKGYVCQILNGVRNPKNGREMLEDAFTAVLRRRRLGDGANKPQRAVAALSGEQEAG